MTHFSNSIKTQRGFTLLEMILVLAIIALISAMIVPSLTVPAKPPLPPLVMFLQSAQTEAIKSGKTQRVYWQGSELLSDPQQKNFTLDKNVVLEIERPGKTGYLGKQLLAVFYPDGSGIAAQFSVIQKQPGILPTPLLRIEISPFTSEISYIFP